MNEGIIIQFTVLLDRLSLFLLNAQLLTAQVRVINQKTFTSERTRLLVVLGKYRQSSKVETSSFFCSPPDLQINIIMTFDNLPFSVATYTTRYGDSTSSL